MPRHPVRQSCPPIFVYFTDAAGMQETARSAAIRSAYSLLLDSEILVLPLSPDEGVEVRGFEPLAFSLRTRRSTN